MLLELTGLAFLAFSPGLSQLTTTVTRDTSQAAPDDPTRSQNVERARETVTTLAFMENRGQWDKDILFYARRGRLAAQVRRDGLQLLLHAASGSEAEVAGVRLDLTFEQSDPGCVLVGETELEGTHAFVLGRGSSRRIQETASFSSVRYVGLREGLDVRVRENAGQLEYDLLVAPGADPTQAVIRVGGGEGLELAEDGSLTIRTAAGPLRQDPPTTWQVKPDGARELLQARFVILDEGRFTFAVDGWDTELPLVVDPTLRWSTFLSSSCYDYIHDVEVGSDGQIYLGGQTNFPDFPVTPGAFDTSCNCGCHPNVGIFWDGWLARLSPDGRTIRYCTYFGGSANDSVNDLQLLTPSLATPGASREPYVMFVGLTASTDLYVTDGSTHSGGVNDGFVAKMRLEQGAGLAFSSYVGSPGEDALLSIAPPLNPWIPRTIVGGYTNLTPGADQDGFLARINLRSGAVLALTVFGGSLNDVEGGRDSNTTWDDRTMSLVREPTGQVTVSGTTYSSDFPVTPGAFDTSYNGGADAFVARFDPSLAGGPVWATFYGGGGNDHALTLESDGQGGVFFGGATTSADLPLANPFDSTYGFTPLIGAGDGWVAQLDSSGSNLVYGTYYGGRFADSVRDLARMPDGSLLVVGWTHSNDFYTTSDAFDGTGQTSPALSGRDGFISQLDTTGAAAGLIYSTYYSGSGMDSIKHVAQLPTAGTGTFDRVVVIGETTSWSLPLPRGNGALGGGDTFVARLRFP